MQAGRELDKLVGLTLGWDVDPAGVIYRRGNMWFDLPRFSTTWEGMGVLVEEARKQGIQIDILPRHNGYVIVWGKRWADNVVSIDAPHGVCMAFLKAKGVSPNA
jgi:hypothetical protein